MNDSYYRTGQAASEWGVSQHRVRRLCETGQIEAKRTPSGQFRIPLREVERWKKAGGPPPVPHEAEPETHHQTKNGTGNYLIDPPSDEVISAAEEVAITETRVKKRKLEWELEEVEDRFREKAQQQAELDEEQDQREIERQERERQAQEEARAALYHRTWRDRWLQHALDSVPYRARNEVESELYSLVLQALAALNPDQPDQLIERMVANAVEQAFKPWRRREEVGKAIEEAANQLPWTAKSLWQPTEWQLRAKLTASNAIASLRGDASLEEITAAARLAGDQVRKEFEHHDACRLMVEGTRSQFSGWTDKDLQAAEESVKKVLDSLPVGASQREMINVRDAALAPFGEEIARRREKEKAEALHMQARALRKDVLVTTLWKLWSLPEGEKQSAIEAVRSAIEQLPEGTTRSELERVRDDTVQPFLTAHARRKMKTELLEAGLREIYPYISKLHQDRDFEGETPSGLEREIRDSVRERLEKEITGTETLEYIKKRVRHLVRAELDL